MPHGEGWGVARRDCNGKHPFVQARFRSHVASRAGATSSRESASDRGISGIRAPSASRDPSLRFGMTVRVEANPDSVGARDRAACNRDLAHRIKSLIGVSAVVETVDPDSIERSMGKARRVCDLRPKA